MASPLAKTRSKAKAKLDKKEQKVETTIIQAVQDYLKSNAFFKAIDSAVEKAIDRQFKVIWSDWGIGGK